MNAIAGLIRFGADGLLIVSLAVAGFVLVFRVKDRWQWYPRIVMAGLTSFFVAKMVSIIYQPSGERPFVEKGLEAGAAYIDNPGFPSDHALLAGAVVLAVWAATRNRRLALGLALAAGIMGVARVLALVHTPIDIVGGFLLALAGGVWYIRRPRR